MARVPAAGGEPLRALRSATSAHGPKFLHLPVQPRVIQLFKALQTARRRDLIPIISACGGSADIVRRAADAECAGHSVASVTKLLSRSTLLAFSASSSPHPAGQCHSTGATGGSNCTLSGCTGRANPGGVYLFAAGGRGGPVATRDAQCLRGADCSRG